MSRTPEDLGIHQHCWELLPWYANGSLDRAERASLEVHLKTCLVCRKELDYLQRLGQALHSTDETDVALQAGLSATLAQIEPVPESRWTSRSWSHKLSSWFGGGASAFLDSPLAVKGVIGVQFVLLLALGSMLLLPDTPSTQPAYVTLSAPELQSSSERARLSITFDEKETERAMRELLLKLGARIVNGPSAFGRYTVELPIPTSAAGPESAMLDRLRTDRRVTQVEVVRPAAP